MDVFALWGFAGIVFAFLIALIFLWTRIGIIRSAYEGCRIDANRARLHVRVMSKRVRGLEHRVDEIENDRPREEAAEASE